jgi:magnesium transporter
VRPDADADEVLRLLRRHRFPALPVVDPGGRLVGVVVANEVMGAAEEEAADEMLLLVGTDAEERLTTPWHQSLRKRLPWLAASLCLAGVAASVVRGFEGTISRWAVLAAYLPVVAGMGGNASAQAMAVAIRGIAVGDARRVRLRRVIARELRVGAASGLITGLAAATIAIATTADQGPLLGALVGVSLFTNHVVACVWGACLPFMLKRLGFDPAQSATIFTTTLTDTVGFATLLGLAAAATAWTPGI